MNYPIVNSATNSLANDESQQLIKFAKDSVNVMRSVMDKVNNKLPYSHRIQFTNRKGRYTSKLNKINKTKYTLNQVKNCTLTSSPSSTSTYKFTQVNQIEPTNYSIEQNAIIQQNCTFNNKQMLNSQVTQTTLQWTPQVEMIEKDDTNYNYNYNYNNNYNYSYNYNWQVEPVYSNNDNVTSLDQLVSNSNDEDFSIDNLLPSITSELFTHSDQIQINSKEYDYDQSYKYICL